MSDSKKAEFCPLTQKKCRDDCAWYHIFIDMDENGVDRETFCAITVIANVLCDLNDFEEEDEYGAC